MNYKYLLFDADDTLLDFKLAEKLAFYKMIEKMGLSPLPIYHERYSAINQSVWERFEKGLVRKEDIGFTRYFEFINELGIDGDAAEFDRTYHDLLGLQGEVFDDSVEVCAQLCRKGYSVNIVTNGFSDTQHSRIALSGLSPYIDKMFISEEIGVQKPKTEFFDKVFEDIGCSDKSKYLIIGDSLSSDILGGINAGIDTCWLNIRNKENNTGIIPEYIIKSLSELFSFL